MDSNKIGFKILINNKIYELVEDQNDYNCNILKDNKVIVTIQNISGISFANIDKYEGEDDE